MEQKVQNTPQDKKANAYEDAAVFATSLLENASDLVAAINTDLRFVLLNAAFRREFELVFGRPVELGQRLDEALAHVTGDRDKAVMLCRRAFAGESFRVTEEFGDEQLLRKTYEIAFSPIYDTRRQVMMAAVVIRDLTMQHLAEQRFGALLEAAPDAMIIVRIDGVIDLANAQAERMFQYDRQQLIGRPVEMLLPERLRSSHIRYRRQFIDEAKARPMGSGRTDLLGLRADGTEFPVEISLNPLAVGGEKMVVAAIRDMTERQRAEDRLRDLSGELEQRVAERTAALEQANDVYRDSEARFRMLADNMPQLAWMADDTGSIFWYNKRWFEYTGTSPEQVLGWGWQTVQHPDHIERVVEKFRRCIKAGVVWEDTFPLRRHDGQYRWFLSRAIPIRDEAGRVQQWSGTNTDITQQRQAEETLPESKARPGAAFDQAAPAIVQPSPLAANAGAFDFAFPVQLERIFPGESEMAGRMRAFDWSNSNLGPPETWPQNLRIALGICLTSRFPMQVWWGDALTMFYNDAYISFLGNAKHPAVLGHSAREAWPDIWDTIGPMIAAVVTSGKASWSEDILMFFDRKLPKEEVYVTFSFSPVFGEDGAAGGVFCACTETTDKIIVNRRLDTLRKLGAQPAEVQSVAETCKTAADVFGENPYDLPFAAIYLVDEPGEQATLAATAGFAGSDHPLPLSVTAALDDESPWPLGPALRTRGAQEVDLSMTDRKLPGGPWPEPAAKALALPIIARENLAGLLVVGISPRRALDDAYRTFLNLVAGYIGTAIADARAYETERRRTEALADLDRAKTTFFNNISHELRTPLTLILGPLEEEIRDNPKARAGLQMAHRNTLRLLKLVNTLLDFSRIEAGRMQAIYQPVDLAKFTAELASNFEAAISNAGLRLLVHCPPLPEPVYVDCAMWEKIVFNLLSNALKFTLQGEIEVSLKQLGDAAQLVVRDSGTGISESELPNLFERFHRARNVPGRTHEGTGIGLALVRDLVQLHAGSVSVQSSVGAGSSFTVLIPLGSAHLNPEHIGRVQPSAPSPINADSYVEEAMQWISDEVIEERMEDMPADVGHLPDVAGARILLAEDNADMRNYLGRLLRQHWAVEAVPDGMAALQAALRDPPDLVLSDIMMPRLDGMELLRRLRASGKTREIPIILLSASVGEESKIESIEAGADDYLIKPFPAREMLARVETHLKLARVRREALDRERELQAKLVDVLENMNDLFVSFDMDWRITYVNAAAERTIAMPRASLLGKDYWTAFRPARGTVVERKFRQTMAERVSVKFELYYEPCGQWFEAEAFPVQNSGLAVYGRNISERKRAEQTALQLAAIVTSSDDAIIGKTLEGTIVSWSAGAERMYGYSPGEMLGRPISTLVPPERPDDTRGILERIRRGERVEHHETVRMCKDGRRIDVSLTVSPILDASGRATGASAIARDISERKRTEEALREREARIRRLVDANIIGVFFWDMSGGISEANDAFLRLSGYSREDLLAGALRWTNLTPPEYRTVDEQAMEELKRTGTNTPFEKEYIRKDGSRVPVLIGGATLEGAREMIVSFVLDLSARKQAEEQVRHMADHDALTGLPNRALLRDRMHQIIACAHRNQLRAAILFIDLDYFKNINDSLGHQIGDVVLQMASVRLQKCLREGDSVARLGGDEFVLILPLLHDSRDAAWVAQKALETLAQPFIVQGHELHLSGSIGISLYPDDGIDVETLMRTADTAMYHAKETGRGNFQFFTAALNQAAQQRLDVSARLRHALEHDEFVLHYQPQVKMDSGAMFSVEALLRWQPPGTHPISCGDFIAYAEESGLIVPIGEWALRQACRQLKIWHDAGHPELKMAVNLSPRQLEQADFCSLVAQILHETGIPGSALELEITESILLQRSEFNLATLTRLSEMGIQLSVDDFGTGYSSLAYLQRFPVHSLKIDQSFVRDIGIDSNDIALITAIISMANSLHLEVVAEGVETSQQAQFLLAHGCLAGQGFYYSKAVPADALSELFR